MKDILVVDCQYDFIDGTLACKHAEEAVHNIIKFINANPSARVFYSADKHSPKHCSYIPNGGTWPVHCQAGTHGAELHASFYTDIINPEQRPNESNTYYKGTIDDTEQYSAFYAANDKGQDLCDVLGMDVLICGIATEFCVKETVKEFAYTWRNIEVSANMLGWVDDEGHKKTLEELSALGSESEKIKAVIFDVKSGDSMIGYFCFEALESVFHEENGLYYEHESIIDTIIDAAGDEDPAKVLASAIAAAPERKQELRDAFAVIGSAKHAPYLMLWLKDKGYRVMCMSQYEMKSEVYEVIRPESPESLAEKYGLVPSECIFVISTSDDNYESVVAAAGEAGFYALPSPNMAHLRRALSKLFVKVDVHD